MNTDKMFENCLYSNNGVKSLSPLTLGRVKIIAKFTVCVCVVCNHFEMKLSDSIFNVKANYFEPIFNLDSYIKAQYNLWTAWRCTHIFKLGLLT